MKNLNKLLTTGKPLAHLRKQLTEQEALLNLVRRLLPAPVDQHCIRAIRHNDILVLMVESSAWSSRVRYLSQNLILQLRSQQFHFKRIQVKISIPENLPSQKKKARQARLLSKDNADILRCMAEDMDDEDLKLSLFRLSQHTQAD